MYDIVYVWYIERERWITLRPRIPFAVFRRMHTNNPDETDVLTRHFSRHALFCSEHFVTRHYVPQTEVPEKNAVSSVFISLNTCLHDATMNTQTPEFEESMLTDQAHASMQSPDYLPGP